MEREQFAQRLREEKLNRTARQEALLADLARAFQLTPMEDPYAYVRALQAGFDGSRIAFSPEYYDALGLAPSPPGGEARPSAPADTDG